MDIGPTMPESTHYPVHGMAAAQHVASGECELGIVLCGTGQGIMKAANKVPGIRCGVCCDTFLARMIRAHNDANMLSLGARVVGEELALDIVDAFVEVGFEGGRHATRVAMIEGRGPRTCLSSTASLLAEGSRRGDEVERGGVNQARSMASAMP